MTLHAPYDPDNIFAKILRGEMPCIKLMEDEIALAFMDVFPQSEGHALIIPKGVTARNLLEIAPGAIGPYMVRVQQVARAVEAALAPDGIRIMQFNGAPAGQTVFHLHVHVIPVWADRTLGTHATGGMAKPETLAPIAARIRAKL